MGAVLLRVHGVLCPGQSRMPAVRSELPIIYIVLNNIPQLFGEVYGRGEEFEIKVVMRIVEKLAVIAA